MFLRSHLRRKNGKSHRYWSVVESRRLASGQSAQRQVLYLGEINDSQEAAWRKSIEVFDEEKDQSSQACLFPDDRPIPADEVNALSLVMSDIRLLRPRSFGDCWLGCVLWRELGLDGSGRNNWTMSAAGCRGRRFCNCWRSTGCVSPAASLPCIASGFWPAPWTSCWSATSRWPRRIGSTAASIAC
jgi:hypothetical protein